MKKYVLLFSTTIMLCAATSPIYGQKHTVTEWSKTYGGTSDDRIFSIRPAINGGYVLAGTTGSNDGDITGYKGFGDGWVTKISDPGGSITWLRSFGGSASDEFLGICSVSDGYVAYGGTQSADGDISINHGLVDAWLVKLSSLGAIVWSKTYGGKGVDEALSMIKTSDGGFAFAGREASSDGDVHGVLHGTYDLWVVKLDGTGNIQWEKNYGGSNGDEAQSIKQTKDGGYIVVGVTTSNDGDVVGHHDSADVWMLKLTDTGSISWTKDLGGSRNENAADVLQAPDGGYIVLANTTSNDGDVSYNHGGYDVWLIKLDTAGTLTWQRTYGGSAGDGGYSIMQTADSGYLISSLTLSNDGDVSGNHGTYDAWLLKTDYTGTVQWQKCFGGKGQDFTVSCLQTSDSEYVIGGGTTSTDGDVTGFHGGTGADGWVLKFAMADSATGVANVIKEDNDIKVYPTYTNGIVHIDMQHGYEASAITLSNTTGVKISCPAVNSNQSLHRTLDMRGQAPGMYILQVLNNKTVTSYKIMYMP